MLILPLFLLFSALVCEFEYEAHMKNRAELDWREFLKFKAARHSFVFCFVEITFCLFALLEVGFHVYFNFRRLSVLYPWPFSILFILSALFFLITTLDWILSASSPESSLTQEVRSARYKKPARFVWLIIAIPILLSIFQIKTNDFDSASRKIPLLVVLFYSRYLGAYLLAYLNDLITSKSFLNGDAELNGIRRIFRRIELSLLASILVSFVFLIR